ncbi:MAG: hypothetical protein ACE5JS_12250 [Nitrospinota bacterium]
MALAFAKQVRLDLSGVMPQGALVPSLSPQTQEPIEGEEVILRFVSILERGAASAAPYLLTYFRRKEIDKETGAIYRREESARQKGESASKEARLLKDVIETKVESRLEREWVPGWPNAEVPRLLRLSLSFQEAGGGTSNTSWVFELPVARDGGGAEGETVGEKSEKAGEESDKAGDESNKAEEQNEGVEKP